MEESACFKGAQIIFLQNFCPDNLSNLQLLVVEDSVLLMDTKTRMN